MEKEAALVYLRLYHIIILKVSLNQCKIFESKIDFVTSQNAGPIILALKCTFSGKKSACIFFSDQTSLPTKAILWLAANRCTDQTRV
jgi:hypothetical protein